MCHQLVRSIIIAHEIMQRTGLGDSLDHDLLFDRINYSLSETSCIHHSAPAKETTRCVKRRLAKNVS